MNNKPYSEWQRIDLHIHTDKSKETKSGDYSGNFSVDTLHSKLVENDVRIFSLTDHNIINLDAYEEYYSKYNSESAPLLLVGVELDIEIIREGREPKNYHSLLIFNYSTIEGARKLSNSLEIKYSEKGLAPLERKLTFDEISEIFFGEDFFFIPHAGNSQSIVAAHGRDEIEDAQKMVILMQSALEKVSREETRQMYDAGFDRKKPAEHRAKKDVAYINFSDNHNINQYPSKHKGSTGIHDFYYVKGSKNYETIRLAFIDPESRIISNEDHKSIRINSSNIERLRIDSCEFIDDVEFEFSPSLNVIIGGRSSGKSLLLWILTKCIDSIVVEETYDLHHYRGIIKTNKDQDLKSITSISKEDIIQISQGEIVKYFEKKDLKQLAYKVGKKDEYQSVLDAFTDHHTSLNNLQNHLVSSYSSVYEETSNKTHILHAKTIDSILSHEVTFNLKSDEILVDIDVADKIDKILEVIDIIQTNISIFDDHSLINITPEQQKVKDDFLDLLKIKEIEIKQLEKMISRKICFVGAVDLIVDTANEKVSAKSNAKYSAKQELTVLKETIKSKFTRYIQLKKYADDIEDFEYGLSNELDLYEDIKLVLEVSNETSLKEEVIDAILNSNASLSIYQNILKLLNKETSVKSFRNIEPDSFKKKVDSQLSRIKKLMLAPNDYLRYSDSETSKEKSPGFNSEKYLEIILKQTSTKTIIIDQPEDNLGNRFISNNLVTLLREIKHSKQIFLVTHNPSIVVYGDAEAIILAENSDNKISYKQIKLEDKRAQKDICDILDGGEYIFKKRSDKYDIKSILNQ